MYVPNVLAAYTDNREAEKFYEKGCHLMEAGHYQDAIPPYIEAVKRDKNFVAAYINLALCYNHVNQPRQAIEAATNALKGNNESSYAYINRSIAYQTLGQWDKALLDVNQAIRYENDAARYYIRRAKIYEKLGQFDKAKADRDHIIHLPAKTADDYYERSCAFYEIGNFVKALIDCTSAIKQKGSDPQLYYQRGLTEATLGNYNKAIADYNRAILLNDKYAQAYYLRGASYLFSNQNDKAILDFKKHIQLTNWQEAHGPYSVMFLAIAYKRLNKDAEAQKILFEGKQHASANDWPAPVIAYLNKQISANELLAKANNKDLLTEAHAYIGADLAAAKKMKAAQEHLSWVKQNGNKSFSEYQLASSILKSVSVK